MKKSSFVNIATLLVGAIGAYSGLFSVTAAAWLSIVSMALTLVLSTWFPSGVFSPSANVASYVVNGAGIIIQLLNATADSALIPAEIVAQVVIGINLVLQVYFKDYTK